MQDYTISLLRAYPKLNIFLKIHQKSGNLHPLTSRFFLALGDLYDEMAFVCFDDTQSYIHNILSSNSNIDEINKISQNKHKKFYLVGQFNCALESNLIYKAYVALQSYAKKEGKNTQSKQQSLVIIVNKKIPVGSGLGGGSANAAITLLVLNQICGFFYNSSILLQLAKELGSDVPFFLIVYSQGYDNISPFFQQQISINEYEYRKKIQNLVEEYNINSFFRQFHSADCLQLKNETKDNKNKLAFLSANVSGTGEIIEPFYEDIVHFRIHCNNIACDTREVYREFDKLQTNTQKSIGYRTCIDSREEEKMQSSRNEQYITKEINRLESKNVDSHTPISSQNIMTSNYDTIKEICLSLDSQDILEKYSIEELNDLYLPACNLYHGLQHIQTTLAKQYNKVFFSGSGSSFFSILSCARTNNESK
ncbi:hypothetical protein CQA53_05445 [Helicobacter didelphidarum]|uniref:GHMP kinase N-terminal domain-containing protein n=1 Tax=Helicobacter didelphidarum TaxID=2040648 RepID=A0A3D8IKW4_9HELI|nr:hypothetical protein [Helicobacter didelphidarum]RDU65892.1 hypothetical protein CQA53_05445 [Helicobacter didelphidarum]